MTWFNYSLIQYVGDPVRHEAVNVGVAVLDIESGDANVIIDGSSFSFIQRLWPDADIRVFRAFARDLAAELRVEHQRFLGEPPPTRGRASARQLDDVGNRNQNQFRVLPPATWRAASLAKAGRDISERFVRRERTSRRRRRHMTRSDLRNLVSEIFNEWARGQDDVVIELDSTIEGVRAPHGADVILFAGEEPRIAAVTIPTSGGGRQIASLLRDSLPTMVSDVRSRHPDLRFYAVFPDEEMRSGTSDDISPEAFRAYLASVEGLRVARVQDLKEEFEKQSELIA